MKLSEIPLRTWYWAIGGVMGFSILSVFLISFFVIAERSVDLITRINVSAIITIMTTVLPVMLFYAIFYRAEIYRRLTSKDDNGDSE